MSEKLNFAMEKSFRSLMQAVDAVPESETSNLLARLALILAHEVNDASRFDDAVRRALEVNSN
jgi:hypothetical protein